MIIEDFSRPVTTVTIHNILRENFNYEFPVDTLNKQKANALLEEVIIRINDFRNEGDYFLGEKNSQYLSMLATARFLTEYLREKKTLLEAGREVADPYHKGIQKAIGHGADTTVKFIPHVAGSAIGAFVNGLKGGSLQSEHGQIKRTDIEVEKKFKNLDIDNPNSVRTFFDKEMKEHFNEYKGQDYKIIQRFLMEMYNSGVKGNVENRTTIRNKVFRLPGNPFRLVTDKVKQKELIDYFYGIYYAVSRLKSAGKDNEKGKDKGPIDKKTSNDVISALINLGYKKNDAMSVVKQALLNNNKLQGNFEALLKSSMGLITKG
jgi:hypothetical protein